MASIKKREDGRYRARYRDETGREHARHFVKKVDAQRWLDEVTASIVTGQYVDPKAGRETVREYAERWRAIQNHRPGTAALYERVLRLHLYPVLGDRALSSVRHSDVRAFLTGLATRLAPNTARQVHAITRTIFRSAVHDRLLPESPFVNVKLPPVRRDRVEPVTIEQVRGIVEAAPDRMRALVVLAAATGLRQGELLGLTVDRVDFLRREVRVDRQLVYVSGAAPYLGPAKTQESVRSVPVPAFALDALAAHLAAHSPGDVELLSRAEAGTPRVTTAALVFQADKGGPMLRTTLHGRWQMTLRRAGLDVGLHFHHLRHHYASVLLDGGESVKAVQERMGHASADETLRTYAHLMPASEQRTRSVVETAWDKIARPADSVRTVNGR
jgi:integrase